MDGAARQSAPHPSRRSEHALDWLNFFVADLEVGFGPFVPVYLAARGWGAGEIGLILSAGTVAGIAAQMPGGALVDAVKRKRLLVAAVVAAGSVLLFASSGFWWVLLAQGLHGSTTGVLAAAMSAIGLGLVGQGKLNRRLGRNHRFDALGNAGTALAMGVLGNFVAKRLTFLLAAALCLPAMAALAAMRGREIDPVRARGAERGTDGAEHPPGRYRDLLRNRRLLAFGLVVMVFQFANASVMPLASEGLGRRDGSELMVAALVVAPQLVAALLAMRVATLADAWGRRTLLAIALGVLVLRIGLFAVVPFGWWLVPAQTLAGIDGAVMGVLIPLVIADVTEKSGRFNLAQGAMGTAIGLAASASTGLSGLLADRLGFGAGFAALAAVAGLGLAAVWLLLPETRQGQDAD